MSYTSTPQPAACLSGQAHGWLYLHVADHCLFGAVKTQTQGMTQKARGPMSFCSGLGRAAQQRHDSTWPRCSSDFPFASRAVSQVRLGNSVSSPQLLRLSTFSSCFSLQSKAHSKFENLHISFQISEGPCPCSVISSHVPFPSPSRWPAASAPCPSWLSGCKCLLEPQCLKYLVCGLGIVAYSS